MTSWVGRFSRPARKKRRITKTKRGGTNQRILFHMAISFGSLEKLYHNPNTLSIVFWASPAWKKPGFFSSIVRKFI
jgi:hypothetical protein